MTVELYTPHAQTLLASAEYQQQTPAAADFVKALFQDVLGRTASSAEVASWAAAVGQLGRAGVAQSFLASAEYRGNVVQQDYAQLLNRTAKPSGAEVAAWVNSPLDLLSIAVQFATTTEFQLNG